MKASEASLLSFLHGNWQFVIPIYQRTYSWTADQCEQLWDDIVRTGGDATIPTHFVGSIVFIQDAIPMPPKPAEFLVIDGQQRLTTLTLLLLALGEAFKERGEAESAEEIQDYYLFNSHAKGSGKHKILLTQSDRDTLIRLLDGSEQEDRASRRLLANYALFREKLRAGSADPATVYHGIAKLVIVSVSLDRTHDNPQLIFESLNSTGLELSQADLIRNYILMGQPTAEMERLYTQYWLPMEQRFSRADYDALFDRFVRDYLTLRTGQIPNIRNVHEAFKQYAHSHYHGKIDELVADLARLARFFVNMAGRKEPDAELHMAFEDIATLKVDVAFPFFLNLYERFAQETLSRADFLAMVRLVESYVFRRAVCGIPTNSLNKTFASLTRDLDFTQPLKSLEGTFRSLTSYRRFPDDGEFERELAGKDVYNFRSRNYLLRKLENARHKDLVVIESHTIEHVLPQNENLSREWRDELGPQWKAVQKQWLHTLGNLTLTLYNSPLSDRPFREKRDMEGGFRKTPVALNDGLRDLDHWDEESIRRRGVDLARLATKAWPSLPPGDVAIGLTDHEAPIGKYSLEDYPNLKGAPLDLFLQLQKRVLNLDSAVTEQINKLYIAYSGPSNFIEVVPQVSGLALILDIPYEDLDDPTGRCRDVSGVGHWGTGTVEVKLTEPNQMEDILYLVLQSFDRQCEDVPV